MYLYVGWYNLLATLIEGRIYIITFFALSEKML